MTSLIVASTIFPACMLTLILSTILGCFSDMRRNSTTRYTALPDQYFGGYRVNLCRISSGKPSVGLAGEAVAGHIVG